METLITVLHVVVAAFLILVVLLQSGHADMGTSFGGGTSGSVLGAAGANKFMTRLTTIAASVFMFTSIALTLLGGPESASSSVVGDVKEPAKPAAAAPAGDTQAPAAAEAVEVPADGAAQMETEGEAAEPAPAAPAQGDAEQGAPAETQTAPAQ